MEILLITIGIVELLFLLKLDKFTVERYKKYIPVLICYILSVIVNLIILSKIQYINDLIEVAKSPITIKITILLVSMVLALLYNPIFVMIMQKIRERRLVKKLEKEYNNVEQYEYYRDIIKNVPLAIIAYVNNKKINVKDMTVAILLNLQHKGNIEINENEIILKNISNIMPYEKLVLDRIKDNKYTEKEFEKQFKNILKEDLFLSGYIRYADSGKANIAYIMEMIMAWIIIYILSTILILARNNEMIFMIMSAYFFTFLSIPIYKFIQKRINLIYRTRKTFEIKAKMKGLKKYIKEYSNINNSDIDIINLYDDFVIYAIIFNMPGKLDDDAKEMYNKTKNMIINFKKSNKDAEIALNVDIRLKKYIDKNILNRYDENNIGGHGREHINTVIKRSFELASEFGLELNANMVYTIAAFHDLGYKSNAEEHERVSSEMFLEDKKIKKFFRKVDRQVIAEAIVDHRASLEYEARSVYGKLVSSADREVSVENMLERSVNFQAQKHKAENPTIGEVIDYSYKKLSSKYGKGGYAKMYYPDQKYKDYLSNMQEILEDKNKFIEAELKIMKEKLNMNIDESSLKNKFFNK